MNRGILGVRTIAAFEAAKATLVLGAGFGLLRYVHRDLEAAAERLILHLHLDPAAHYPQILMHVATTATPWRLRLLALGALCYALIRLAEAYGLWYDLSWAEWIGVISGLIYVPFEVAHAIRHADAEAFAAIAVNLLVVAYLGLRLRARRRALPSSP